MTSSGGSPHLPEDVTINILLRLPVKSLLRFMSVCKVWNSIITSSYFVNDHFRRPTNPTNLVVHGSGTVWFDKFGRGRKPLDLSRPFPDSFHSISLFPDETLENFVDLDMGFFSRTHVHNICGPCNGIFCVLLGNETLAFWNPATKKLWQALPLHSPRVKRRDIFSFWVDPVTKDFKIFLIQNRIHRFARYDSCTDSWRYFLQEEFDPRYLNYLAGEPYGYSVLNGFYYFMKPSESGWSGCVIIAFDILDEVFHEIDVPLVDLSGASIMALHVYDDSLALVSKKRSYMPGKAQCEIWLMKENGCWTKLFNVVLDNDMEPFMFWNRNELLIAPTCNRDQLMIVEIASGKTRRIKIGTTFVDVEIASGKTRRIEIGATFEDVDYYGGHTSMVLSPLLYRKSLFSMKK